jgi:hypothetical protein
MIRIYMFIGLVALLLSVQCGPAKDSVLFSGRGASQAEGISIDVLKDYRLTDSLQQALAIRLGCEAASQLALGPSDRSLYARAQAVQNAEDVYQSLLKEFFATDDELIRCMKRWSAAGASRSDDRLRGVKQLIKALSERGYSLTMLAVGGFGSHLTTNGTLWESRQLWAESANEIKDETGANEPLRAWRIECENSYAPDDVCAPQLLAQVKQLDIEHSVTDPAKNLFLIWGYSKGTNTALQALTTSRELRERTLAIVSLGAPIAGSGAIELAEPFVAEILRRQMAGDGDGSLQLPFPVLAALAPAMNWQETLAEFGRYMIGDAMTTVAAGAKSLRPDQRMSWLQDRFHRADMKREELAGFRKSTIPVFHLSALTHMGELRALPALTYRDGLVIDERSFSFDDTKQFPLSFMSMNYAINDTCVALEHSVLPKKYLPGGVESELIGILRSDHLAMGLSQTKDSGIPPSLIVDAVTEAVVERLKAEWFQ